MQIIKTQREFKGRTMNTTFFKQLFNQLLSITLSLSIGFTPLFAPANANAAALALSDVPIDVTSTTYAAKPNFMYILDNSGSMVRDYIMANKSDDSPPLHFDGQCKAGLKDRGGYRITGIKKVGNRLKINLASGSAPMTLNDIIYVTIPEFKVSGQPVYSGVYEVKASNYTAPVCPVPLVSGYVVQNPFCSGNARNAFEADPGCKCTGSYANDPNNHTSDVYYNDGATIAGAPSTECRTVDPADYLGTSCPVPLTGGDGLSFEIELTNELGVADQTFSSAEIQDAYAMFSIDFNTNATPTPSYYYDSSWCYSESSLNSTFGFEPPNASAQVNSLYYNPNVTYEPPPQPNKTGNAYPNNLLPSMTRSYTNEWGKVPNNGLLLMGATMKSSPTYSSMADIGITAVGEPLTANAHSWMGGNANKTQGVTDLTLQQEEVWCDTPYIPASFSGNYVSWLTSNRCKANSASNNTSVRSPNYPYQYPVRLDGLATGNPSNPSQSNFYSAPNPHQYGDTLVSGLQDIAAVNPSAFSPSTLGVDGFNVFGIRFYDANPHYFNDTPIEYCTTAQLTDCELASTFTPTPTPDSPPASHPFPSYVRYCKSYYQANAAIKPQAGNCQAQFTGSSTVDFSYAGNSSLNDFHFARYGLFNRVEITKNLTGKIDSTKTYAKKAPLPTGCESVAGSCTSGRYDCVTNKTSCTADEEMTNYANWWAYYRTRSLMMKSASARALVGLGDNMRVGLMTINDPQEASGVDSNGNGFTGAYLKVDDFTGTAGGQKEQWLTTLYAVPETNAATPLRKALSIAGRVFAGKANTSEVADTTDPVKFYCQKNISLLTTDGFWTGSLSDGTATNILRNNVGDQDGAAAPPKKDSANQTNTLADVAMYYNTPSLRQDSSVTGYNNCQNTSGLSTDDLCGLDPVTSLPKEAQKMRTFTMGLGVNGTLGYDKNYQKGTSPDYELIKTGTENWPVPVANAPEAVDDLWHAAVNGDGAYFSARSPQEVTESLQTLFKSLDAGVNAGSPPAVSNQRPSSDTAHPDYGFSATYVKGDWTGNLIARKLSSAFGSLYTTDPPVWCADTPSALDASVPSTCDVSQSLPSVTASTRNILMAGTGSTGLKSFAFTNLSVSQQAYFQSAHIGSLSQWATLSATQQANADEDNLVNFIRGDKTYEQTSTTAANRLFRERKGILGDITESDPVFVGDPIFQYLDAGYMLPKSPATTSFVDDQKTQAKKTVYVGANDGMLHAFDATNGHERWAFVPTALLPNLYKLADINYKDKHINYVNGKATVGDYYDGSKWRKLLVSGFGSGARGLFGIDITNPDSPILLWENYDSKLGYIYGKPTIAKKEDGSWVVLTTSGYNNSGGSIGGDGKGRFIQINPTTGAITYSADLDIPANVTSINTVTGSTYAAQTPGNLAPISALAVDPISNAESTYAYAGDVYGNLWVYDITHNTVSGLAQLKVTKTVSSVTTSVAQPITTAPILAKINGNADALVMLGTGKMLEQTDVASTDLQTIYAIKDNHSSTFLGSPRGNNGTATTGFVKQEFTTTAAKTVSGVTTPPSRTMTSNNVNLATDNGWWVDIDDAGERVITRGFLLADVLMIPSVASEGSTCSPTGHSWLNHFNFQRGTSVAESYMDSAAVGTLALIKLDSDGNDAIESTAIGVDNSTLLTKPDMSKVTKASKRRMSWHELVNP